MIQIKNFSKSYGNEKVFENFNLEVEKSEVLEIEGETGKGKTTLLRCIAGLEEYQGEIKKYGKISYLFQEQRILEWLNIRKNILIPVKLSKEPVTEKHVEKMEKLAERLGVEEHLDKKTEEVSGGQMQRILLIRALITDPEILLLDEPFNSLDLKTRKNIYKEIIDISKQNNQTLLIASHQEDLSEITDRTIHL
ncbi:MAG: NitT/TauT family transport system ATP-binding protein [Candidatus Nanohaloarchaea archaeon]|jgi:NitT/TauT family transport system ATP-binding protein